MMTFQILSRSKPIPGYEGIYEAHDDGTIWTAKGKTTFRILNGQKRFRVWKQRQLKYKKENREQFRYTSGLEEELMDVLDNKFKNKKFIKNTELAFALFANRDALGRNTKESRDIRYYMEHLGYKVGARIRIDGQQYRGFVKE